MVIILLQLFIGDYPYKRFTEANILSSIEKFQGRLQEITGEITVRNEKMDMPYTYMLPKCVPNSITI